MSTSDGSVISVLVVGLQEYVAYNISVRAYTSVGGGPPTPEVTEKTFEDRKCAERK